MRVFVFNSLNMTFSGPQEFNVAFFLCDLVLANWCLYQASLFRDFTERHEREPKHLGNLRNDDSDGNKNATKQ